jgi:hypothetical protein
MRDQAIKADDEQPPVSPVQLVAMHKVPHVSTIPILQVQQATPTTGKLHGIEHPALAALRHNSPQFLMQSSHVCCPAATWRSSTRQAATLVEQAAIDGHSFQLVQEN